MSSIENRHSAADRGDCKARDRNPLGLSGNAQLDLAQDVGLIGSGARSHQCLHGALLVVEDSEDLDQPGDVEDFLDLRIRTNQIDRSAVLRARASEPPIKTPSPVLSMYRTFSRLTTR